MDKEVRKDLENPTEYIDSEKGQYSKYQCAKQRYVQIKAVDTYIENFNDWD
ncbi:MAG: hypothetical protein HDR79_06845 [Bacteroides sp.]|nr:hypothetical protein [Bacteroides sp.]